MPRGPSGLAAGRLPAVDGLWGRARGSGASAREGDDPLPGALRCRHPLGVRPDAPELTGALVALAAGTNPLRLGAEATPPPRFCRGPRPARSPEPPRRCLRSPLHG